jgi:hypothetical protein
MTESKKGQKIDGFIMYLLDYLSRGVGKLGMWRHYLNYYSHRVEPMGLSLDMGKKI